MEILLKFWNDTKMFCTWLTIKALVWIQNFQSMLTMTKRISLMNVFLLLYNLFVTVDWLIVNMASVRGKNIGHVRYVLKNTLQAIPLFGWYFYAHGCIYVHRGKFNQDKMKRALEYLCHEKINVSLEKIIWNDFLCFAIICYRLFHPWGFN